REHRDRVTVRREPPREGFSVPLADPHHRTDLLLRCHGAMPPSMNRKVETVAAGLPDSGPACRRRCVPDIRLGGGAPRARLAPHISDAGPCPVTSRRL